MFCSENTAPPRSGLIYVIYLHCSRFLPYDAAEKKSKLLDDMQRLFDSIGDHRVDAARDGGEQGQGQGETSGRRREPGEIGQPGEIDDYAHGGGERLSEAVQKRHAVMGLLRRGSLLPGSGGDGDHDPSPPPPGQGQDVRHPQHPQGSQYWAAVPAQYPELTPGSRRSDSRRRVPASSEQ